MLYFRLDGLAAQDCLKKHPMPNETRLIFWLDLVVLLVVAGLVIAGQWDFVLALFIALIFMNYFDGWWNRRRPQ